MNKVFLLGRLVRDPEVKTTQSGKMVTTFTLAVNRFGQNGETDFISIVTWEKLAEACGNNLSKGLRAMVEGRLQIRSYEGRDGQKKWITEIIAQAVEFLDRSGSHQSRPETNNDPASQFGHDVPPDDEIPF